MSSVESLMKDLMEEVKQANASYYLSAKPIMTDFEYDEKKKQLRQLAEQHQEAATKLGVYDVLNAVGAHVDTNSYEPMKHNPPMLSLDNSYTEEDVQSWTDRCAMAGARRFVVTPKYDGLAWEIVYENGRLIEGGTRGDGFIGENLMATTVHVRSIPKRIPIRGRVCVRGEKVLSWLNFETAKELDGVEYANPRNAAAGIARRKIPGPSTSLLSFVAYGLVMDEMPATYTGSLELLKSWGFEVTEYKEATDLSSIMNAIGEVEQKRPSAKYMYDGAVVRVNDNAVYEKMGYTSHHPKAATAFKFKADRAETKLKDVEWTRGKKGKISPNARLETVQLAGTKVSNALLHTLGKIAELNIKIGDVVIVEKAAEIIPQVVGVRKDLRTGEEKDIVAPTHCPVCGTATVMRGEYVYCENKNCGDAPKNKLLTYVAQIGFRGIGPSTAEKLAVNGSFTEVPDLYMLTEDDFIRAGVAPKNATKLVESIRQSVGQNKPKEVLAGLSIDMCGIGTATDIIEEAGHTIRELCNKPASWFAQIQNVGQKTAEALADWFGDPNNVAIVEKLYELGVIVDDNSKPGSQAVHGQSEDLPFSGMKICITGTLSKPRSHFTSLIEENGGTFINQFSKSIDVLVVGENAGSKLKKAQDAGIEVWTEEDFMKKIG